MTQIGNHEFQKWWQSLFYIAYIWLYMVLYDLLSYPIFILSA